MLVDFVLDSEFLAFHFGDSDIIGRGSMSFLIDGVIEICMFATQGGYTSFRVHDFSHLVS